MLRVVWRMRLRFVLRLACVRVVFMLCVDVIGLGRSRMVGAGSAFCVVVLKENCTVPTVKRSAGLTVAGAVARSALGTEAAGGMRVVFTPMVSPSVTANVSAKFASKASGPLSIATLSGSPPSATNVPTSESVGHSLRNTMYVGTSADGPGVVSSGVATALVALTTSGGATRQ